MKTERLSEIECALYAYFRANILPIMRTEKDALQEKRADETRGFQYSFLGFMRSLSLASNPNALGMDDPVGFLSLTGLGEDVAKKPENFVSTCKQRIANKENIQDDLCRLATEWRTAVINEVGRKKYDEACESIGSDLALAYIDHKVEMLMLEQMAADQMPKSSFDFILRKGASQSLFGLQRYATMSPLETQIEAMGEAAYNPSKAEKWAARGTAFVADAATLGGFSSWGSLISASAIEVGFGLAFGDENPELPMGPSVEECISKGVFGCDENIFPDITASSYKITLQGNEYLQEVSDKLGNQLPISSDQPTWTEQFPVSFEIPQFSPYQPNDFVTEWQATENAEYAAPDVDKTASGNEITFHENSPEFIGPPRPPKASDSSFNSEIQDLEHIGKSEQEASEQGQEHNQPQPQPTEGNDQGQEEKGQKDTVQTNEKGWGQLLGAIGLSGFGDVTKNLGYVLAMLPDMLFGFFTGKNKKFNLGDNLMPVASVLLGMLVKNPVLKMLLIGIGGANLINKAGHEALDKAAGKSEGRATAYREYEDEPLNPRISNPVISGQSLIATIDKSPYSILLSQSAVDAYHSGALPLNTLANAVLKQYDKQREMALSSYSMQQDPEQNRHIQLR